MFGDGILLETDSEEGLHSRVYYNTVKQICIHICIHTYIHFFFFFFFMNGNTKRAQCALSRVCIP